MTSRMTSIIVGAACRAAVPAKANQVETLPASLAAVLAAGATPIAMATLAPKGRTVARRPCLIKMIIAVNAAGSVMPSRRCAPVPPASACPAVSTAISSLRTAASRLWTAALPPPALRPLLHPHRPPLNPLRRCRVPHPLRAPRHLLPPPPLWLLPPPPPPRRHPPPPPPSRRPLPPPAVPLPPLQPAKCSAAPRSRPLVTATLFPLM